MRRVTYSDMMLMTFQCSGFSLIVFLSHNVIRMKRQACHLKLLAKKVSLGKKVSFLTQFFKSIILLNDNL